MCNFPLLARHTPVNLGQPSADNDCPLGLWLLQGRHRQEQGGSCDGSFWVSSWSCSVWNGAEISAGF